MNTDAHTSNMPQEEAKIDNSELIYTLDLRLLALAEFLRDMKAKTKPAQK